MKHRLPSEPDGVITKPHAIISHHPNALSSKPQGCHVDGAMIPRCFYTVRHTLNTLRRRQMRQVLSQASRMHATACLTPSAGTEWIKETWSALRETPAQECAHIHLIIQGRDRQNTLSEKNQWRDHISSAEKRPGSEVFSLSIPWLGSWTSGGSHQWPVGW